VTKLQFLRRNRTYLRWQMKNDVKEWKNAMWENTNGKHNAFNKGRAKIRKGSYFCIGVLKDVQTYYSIDNSQAGLLQSSFIIGYTLFSMLFGYLGDRFSRKWIMTAGIVFWSGVTLASSFVRSQVTITVRFYTQRKIPAHIWSKSRHVTFTNTHYLPA